MKKRSFDTMAQDILVDYGSEVLIIAREEPEFTGERVRRLNELRAEGVKRLRALVAEFGKGEA